MSNEITRVLAYEEGGTAFSLDVDELMSLGLEELVGSCEELFRDKIASPSLRSYKLIRENGKLVIHCTESSKLKNIIATKEIVSQEFINKLINLLKKANKIIDGQVGIEKDSLKTLAGRIRELEKCRSELRCEAKRVAKEGKSIFAVFATEAQEEKAALTKKVLKKLLFVEQDALRLAKRISPLLPQESKTDKVILQSVERLSLFFDGLLGAWKLKDSYASFVEAGKYGDSEGCQDAKISIARSSGSLAAVSLLGGLMTAKEFASVGTAAAAGLSYTATGMFGILGVVGIGVYTNNMARCYKFRHKLNQDLKKRGEEETFKKLYEDVTLSDENIDTIIEKAKEKHPELKRAAENGLNLKELLENSALAALKPEQTKNEKLRELKQVYDLLKEAQNQALKRKEAFFKRRSGANCVKLLQVKGPQILRGLKNEKTRNAAKNEMQKIIGKVKAENRKKILIDFFSLIAAVIGLAALITAFFVGGVAIVLGIISAAIGLLITVYTVYQIVDEHNEVLGLNNTLDGMADAGSVDIQNFSQDFTL